MEKNMGLTLIPPHHLSRSCDTQLQAARLSRALRIGIFGSGPSQAYRFTALSELGEIIPFPRRKETVLSVGWPPQVIV